MADAQQENQANSKHVWKFFRAGGLSQASIQSGDDLLALEKLDQKLWVALSCPTRGLEFDTKTLDFIDLDKDGRIRVPEVIEAVKWATARLKSPGDLLAGGDALPLAALNDGDKAGAELLGAARQILEAIGKPDAKAITVADVDQASVALAKSQMNGDGVIPPETLSDPALKQVAADVIATVGAVPDRGGAAGINQELLDKFFAELSGYSDWRLKVERGPEAATILFLGEATSGAWQALCAVRAKIDDFFARCRLAAFDPRSAGPLNRAETEFVALAPRNLGAYGDEIAGLPLARVEPDRVLPLVKGINPAWDKPMEQFRSAVVAPVFGAAKSELSEAEWRVVIDKFGPFVAWQAAKQGAAVEKLGLARIREMLSGKSREALSSLLARDLALSSVVAQMSSVEKLIRYYRNLAVLLNNFVNFGDFYSKDRNAVFQAGTLYMDGRACQLCLRVSDAGAHAPVGTLGRIYLAYCECKRPAKNEKMVIAAAFTRGDADSLRVGRNGVFYDRNGQDWDATIIRTVEHPVSIRQAFWYPYKRIGRIIGEQIEKFAAAREKSVMDKATSTVDATATAAEKGKPAEKPKFDTGTMAALWIVVSGLAGALSGAFAAVLALAGSDGAWWKVPAVIGGIMCAISGPSMIIAWLKLRTRDLAPVLDACGWAINGRIKVNIPLARTLTDLANLPSNAIPAVSDLYPEEPSKVKRWVVWFVVIAALIALLELTGGLKWLGIDDLLTRFFSHRR